VYIAIALAEHAAQAFPIYDVIRTLHVAMPHPAGISLGLLFEDDVKAMATTSVNPDDIIPGTSMCAIMLNFAQTPTISAEAHVPRMQQHDVRL
jgi:hypothetical protein